MQRPNNVSLLKNLKRIVEVGNLSYNNKKLCICCISQSNLLLPVLNKKLYSKETSKYIHTEPPLFSEKAVLCFKDFEHGGKKNKNEFLKMIRVYEQNFQNRKGNAEFITTALKCMKEYGVHRDLNVYKKLVDIMPKGVYIAENKLLAEAMYYPQQQQAVIDLLDSMEHYGVIPDKELGVIIKSIFGKGSYSLKKYYGLVYWSTKFKNKSPWFLPKKITSDPFTLAKMAIERITSVDVQTEITVFKTNEILESNDKTWIVSGQSPKQKELLSAHKTQEAVIVEGGSKIWLRDKSVSYFVLKADAEPTEWKPPKDSNDWSDLQTMYFNPNYVEETDENERSLHEQDNEIIYAVCATGTSSKDSLLSWVRLLQKYGNPILGEIPVLFRFISADKSPVPISVVITKDNEIS